MRFQFPALLVWREISIHFKQNVKQMVVKHAKESNGACILQREDAAVNRSAHRSADYLAPLQLNHGVF